MNFVNMLVYEKLQYYLCLEEQTVFKLRVYKKVLLFDKMTSSIIAYIICWIILNKNIKFY